MLLIGPSLLPLLLREISDVWSVQFEKIASKNGKTEIKAYRCHCFDLKEPFLESVIRRVQVEKDIPVCKMRETIDNDTVVFMLTHSPIQGNRTKWMENHITQKSLALPLALSQFIWLRVCDKMAHWCRLTRRKHSHFQWTDIWAFKGGLHPFGDVCTTSRHIQNAMIMVNGAFNIGRDAATLKNIEKFLGWLVQRSIQYRFALFPLICFIQFSSFHPIGLPPDHQFRARDIARFALQEQNCANNKCCARWWFTSEG